LISILVLGLAGVAGPIHPLHDGIIRPFEVDAMRSITTSGKGKRGSPLVAKGENVPVGKMSLSG
jgi:hypothetical protein